MSRELVVLDAPSNLGLSPPAPGIEPGCRRAPEALRARGVVERLGARDAGSVPAPPYTPDRDDTGTRNGRAIAAYSGALADRTASLLAEGSRPLVLGGDCSILLGNLLALSRSGRPGLLFVDGHLDFRHPGTSAVAGEDLALATGRGHPALTDLEGRGPLVLDADVVACGNREWDEQSLLARETAMTIVDADAIHATGAGSAVATGLAALRERDVTAAWLHVDIDVLDPRLMPAVDSPDPGGLDWDELTALLTPLAADPIVAGLELTVFDPTLDPDGDLAERIVRMLVDVLG